MKTTVVPAQITSVEDRIAGNLTFTQIFLLTIPLFSSAALYMLLPPHNGISVLKIVLIVVQFMVFGSLSLRIRGKVVLDWLLVYLRFTQRPRFYIFTKNDLSYRNLPEEVSEKEVATTANKPRKREKRQQLSIPEHSELMGILANPGMSISFAVNQKGGMDVSLSKTQG